MPILFRDYETRSTLDLTEVGAWRYSTDPSTDIWCCAYCIDDGEIKLWLPGDPTPTEFIEAANNADWHVAAFNDSFERLIEQHIMAPRYGFPLVPIERHRCLQAAALAHALPGSLDGAAAALSLKEQKDAAGRHVMLQMAKPRRPRKDEVSTQTYWFDDAERRQQLYSYCRQDVATERELHRQIGFLTDNEQALWLLDAIINDRGIHIDRELLNAAIKIAEAAQTELGAELMKITAGAVENVHQTARLLDWLGSHGCKIPDLRKPALEKVLARSDLSPECRRVIELRLDGAHAAAAKLSTMRDWLGPDNRVRGTLKFHGASTGRWSSHGIQLQNLKRPVVEDMDAAIAAVCTGSLAHLRQSYSQPVGIVGDTTRALICAQPGHRLIAADFSGVESRITAWLSGQQSKLDQWARFDQTQDPKDEPYYTIGRAVFGVAEESARAIGKTGDLAFGYMGGIGAWRKLAPDDNSTDDQIKRRQQAWRSAHRSTADFWKVLDLRGALRAVQNPCSVIRFQRPSWQRLAFKSDGTFLRMILPSGRTIAYPFPQLKTNGFGKPNVVFMDNSRGKWAECRNGEGAYGGLWIENAVQAVARDLFAAAMIRLEAAGYRTVLHVHDEIVAEVPDGFGNTKEFLRILTTPPEWATGLPIAAKVREGPRFCKSNQKPAETPAVENIEEFQATTSTSQPDDAVEANGNAAEEPARASNKNQQDEARAFNGYASGEKPWGKNVAEYIYYAADGQPYLRVRRTSEKQFPQFHWDGGRWVKGKPAGPKIPYRLPELIAAKPEEPVFICEGEKDSNNVAALDLVATTNSEGAGKWTADLNKWFVGKQMVYLLEDNDDAGRAHVAKIAGNLHGVVPSIRVISFPELPEHGDVSDWIEMGGSKVELLERAKTAKEANAPLKLQWVDMSRWDYEPVPERKWAIPDRVPINQAGLFSGEGGTGKSIIELMKNVAHVAAKDWLGSLPVLGPAFYLGAEDEEDEIHRRLAAIAEHYGVTFGQLVNGGLHVLCLLGKDATLCAAAGKSGKVETTDLYRQLYEAAGDLKPRNISIDTLTRAFNGSEIDRVQVHAFATHMQALAMVTDGGSVTVLSHPSLQGISSGSGISGSTGWHNAFRFRQYLKGVKPENGEQPDNDLRELAFLKNQYGRLAETIMLRYQDGLFLPEAGVFNLDQAARQTKAEEIFLELLHRFTTENRYVSDRKSPNYAPAIFAKEDAARQAGINSTDLAAAMRRLFAAKKIWNEPYGKPSRGSYRVAAAP